GPHGADPRRLGAAGIVADYHSARLLLLPRPRCCAGREMGKSACVAPAALARSWGRDERHRDRAGGLRRMPVALGTTGGGPVLRRPCIASARGEWRGGPGGSGCRDRKSTRLN